MAAKKTSTSKSRGRGKPPETSTGGNPTRRKAAARKKPAVKAGDAPKAGKQADVGKKKKTRAGESAAPATTARQKTSAKKKVPAARRAGAAPTPRSVVVVDGTNAAGGSKTRTPSQHLAEHAPHADIVRGIEARKAAAKAKSMARNGRTLAAKMQRARKLTDKQMKSFENMLLRIRDELSRQIAYLRGTSLTRSDEVNPEEDGTDAFERQLALKLASSEGDAVFEIDEALHRIKEGSYGVCEDCCCVISLARLKALPFARRCVECKSRAEAGRAQHDRRYF